MTKATQKTSRNRAASQETDAPALAADLTFVPERPVDMLSVTAAANEARLASDQAAALQKAVLRYKEGHDLRRVYSAQFDIAEKRASAMRDVALMLLARDPFEALLQVVHLWADMEEVASGDVSAHHQAAVCDRIDFALESITRVLEEASGHSRKEAGNFYQRLERSRPHMEAVPAGAAAE